MPTKAKAVPPPKPKTPADLIRDAVYNHIETIMAIHQTYGLDDGETVELETANDNLKTKLEELLEDIELVEEFEPLYDKMKELYLDEDEQKKLFRLLSVDKLDANEILSEIDPGVLTDRMTDQGYSYIRLPGMADKAKLEEFITRELYPHFNDQNSSNYLL